MSRTIAIDPVTRLEGHLAVKVEVESGRVTKAWCSGEMFRGFENILRGRDPLDAQQITERICGCVPFPLVLAGLFLAAWIDHFTRVGPWVLGVLSLLTLCTLLVDFLAAALGAKPAGATKLALLGAALGTLIGLFFGLIGVIFFPFAGAALGQFISTPDLFRAGKVGFATWLGMLCGMVAKVGIIFIMLGIFAVAYFW